MTLPPEQAFWSVPEGACQVDSDDKKCLVSPRYPKPYAPKGKCVITPVLAGKIKVDKFETEKTHDTLEVKGTKFSGEVGPHNLDVTPADTLKWDSDGSKE